MDYIGAQLVGGGISWFDDIELAVMTSDVGAVTAPVKENPKSKINIDTSTSPVINSGFEKDEAVERVLVEADFGPTAFEISEELEQKLRRGTLKSMDAVRTWLRGRIAHYLPPSDRAGLVNLGDGSSPGIVLVLA